YPTRRSSDLGLIRHGAEEKNLRLHAAHHALEIVRSQYESGFITHLGGAIREPDRFADALGAGACDQNLVRRRVLRRPLPYLKLFFDREVRAFPGRARDQVSGEAGAIPLLDVVLD